MFFAIYSYLRYRTRTRVARSTSMPKTSAMDREMEAADALMTLASQPRVNQDRNGQAGDEEETVRDPPRCGPEGGDATSFEEVNLYPEPEPSAPPLPRMYKEAMMEWSKNNYGYQGPPYGPSGRRGIWVTHEPTSVDIRVCPDCQRRNQELTWFSCCFWITIITILLLLGAGFGYMVANADWRNQVDHLTSSTVCFPKGPHQVLDPEMETRLAMKVRRADNSCREAYQWIIYSDDHLDGLAITGMMERPDRPGQNRQVPLEYTCRLADSVVATTAEPVMETGATRAWPAFHRSDYSRTTQE